MLYRPPIRVRPSLVRQGTIARPAALEQKQPAPISPFDLASVVKMVEDIKGMHGKVLEALAHAGNIEDLKKMHQETLEKGERIFNSIGAVKQGKPGEPGKPAAEVDLNEVARRAAALVPKPKDGDTPVVDLKKIAKSAAKYVKVPEAPAVEAVDPDTVLQKVVEMLKSGDVKLHVKNLEGFEQTIAPIRNLAAKNGGIRGGGDTVAAGTNVTITTNGSGQKVINALGANLAVITVTGTVDDSNKTFSAATQPTLLNINGAFYLKTGGAYTWTYAGTTITLNQPVGAGGSIFGI